MKVKDFNGREHEVIGTDGAFYQIQLNPPQYVDGILVYAVLAVRSQFEIPKNESFLEIVKEEPPEST